MRALQIAELDGPDALSVVEVPEPAANHFLTPDEGVLIDVKAAAVSFPDVLQSRGLYQFKPDLPFVPGAEVAGVVVEAAPDSGLQAGDATLLELVGYQHFHRSSVFPLVVGPPVLQR